MVTASNQSARKLLGAMYRPFTTAALLFGASTTLKPAMPPLAHALLAPVTPASPRKAERTKHFICDHCYKSFATNEEADDHMLVCSRNPASDARRSARFTLNSCYDEIQPPPPF